MAIAIARQHFTAATQLFVAATQLSARATQRCVLIEVVSYLLRKWNINENHHYAQHFL
jgi:hypothetical protein